jgi:Spy/CpxP family protein refolding chaperone
MSANLATAAPARFDWNPKVLGALTLALVFLCGAVIGALAMDFGVHPKQGTATLETLQGKGKAATFARLQKELDLTPAQSQQVESTLNDFWQYYRTVLTDCKQRLEQSLTPAQKAKFERLLQEPPK